VIAGTEQRRQDFAPRGRDPHTPPAQDVQEHLRRSATIGSYGGPSCDYLATENEWQEADRART
jgi:hypothetical protein